MANYKVIRRVYLVKDEKEITEETECFDWISDDDIFEKSEYSQDFNWHKTARNGKFGVVDFNEGALVLKTIYNVIEVRRTTLYGLCLFLKWEDEEQKNWCGYYSVLHQKFIFEFQCDDMRMTISDKFMSVYRDGRWQKCNIKTGEFFDI